MLQSWKIYIYYIQLNFTGVYYLAILTQFMQNSII